MAVPGQGIMHFLHKSLDKTLPIDVDVDLIMVDFGVNDCVANFNDDYVGMAHEKLIRHVRNDMLHSPALLYVETFIAPDRALQAPQQAANMAKVHGHVTRKYDIPMVRHGWLRVGGLSTKWLVQ